MPRKINIFEERDVRDYNKPVMLSSLRANCVRAVELDDRLGGKKDSAFLNSMKRVAEAIYSELGVKASTDSSATALEEANKVAVEQEAKLSVAAETIDAMEAELVELDEKIEEQEDELTKLNKKVEGLEAEIVKLKASKKPAAKKATKKVTK